MPSSPSLTSRLEALLGLARVVRSESDLREAAVLRGPQVSEWENPSTVGGDLAGGAYELDQLLVFRPAPELCRYRTPLRGLYVAGASVHPGGAVHGMSGRGAARAVLRDCGLRRRGARRARTRARRRPRA